jgi:hypothetical protein
MLAGVEGAANQLAMRGAVTRARSGRPAGVAGREDVRTPAASSGPPWGCPSNRSSGRPASRCPVSGVRCPVSGVRCIQVSGRTRSGVCGAAAALSAPRWPRSGSVWRAAPAGRSGSTCRRGLWAAWSPAGIGPDGKGMVRRWPWLARTRVDVAQGRRLAGVPAAAPPWPQRADTGAGPGPGCRPGGAGSMGRSRGPQPRRASWSGRRRGADHDLDPAGDDHAVWSLGAGGPVASSSGGPTRFGGGAACGRGAAAARKERCLLAADRSLTSKNTGGRDRV